MRTKIHFYLATIFSVTFLSAPSFATTTGYQQFYIPVYTDGAENVPELFVTSGIFVSTGAFPETAVSAALFPYYAHAVGYGSESWPKEGYNINPASTMHLEIEMNAFPVETCSISLDLSRMTVPDSKNFPSFEGAVKSGEVSTTQVLEKVVEAMERNFALSGYAHPCAFSVKGLEKHPEVEASIKPDSPLLKTVLKSSTNAQTQ